MRTVFPCVDDAVAHIANANLLGQLNATLAAVEGTNSCLKRQMRRYLDFIESGGLRRALERRLHATGKLEFSFEQDAWMIVLQTIEEVPKLNVIALNLINRLADLEEKIAFARNGKGKF